MNSCEAIDKALAFKAEYPTENASTAARIYGANEASVRSALNRERVQKRGSPRGGHNKILSDAQIKALFKYIEDLYFSGLGAAKQMVFGAITHLTAAENPPKKPPSRRWFQSFLQQNPNLLRAIKAKPIAITTNSGSGKNYYWRGH